MENCGELTLSDNWSAHVQPCQKRQRLLIVFSKLCIECTRMERKERLRKRRKHYCARRNRETAKEIESQLEEEHMRVVCTP